MSLPIKQILSYYPLRYYAAAIFFALIFINTLDSIGAVEEYLLLYTLNTLHVPAFISNGNLFLGQASDAAKVTMPMYVQLLFFVFFPTVAITARTNIVTRVKVISFGLLCFLIFTATGLLTAISMLVPNLAASDLLIRAISITLTIVSGSLLIELTLFSTITIPPRTSIKPIIKRRYTKEYAYFVSFMAISSFLLYGVVTFLHVDIDSPIIDYVNLVLWLNLSTIVTLGYFVSNLIYEIKRPRQIKRIEAAYHNNINKKQFSVSFLIPAFNEEKIVGRCIESIDRAASNYDGDVEIILINDGSYDNTEKIVAEKMGNLKYATGRFFTIPNSGKGFALVYGLEKTSGEIIFRTDADSVIDEHALTAMMGHFNDPQVGSVCGWVFPLEGKGVWIKAQNVLCANYMYTKRAQEVTDSIITQPGSSTAFRKEALLNVGGWQDNIFGEDGEITNRIARYGYRGVFEPRSIVYSEHPDTLIGLMQQRARWGVAFFHSRGRNLKLTREFRTPRSLMFLWNLAAHGGGLGRSLMWPYLAASAISLSINFSSLPPSEQSVLGTLFVRLAAIQVSITVIQIALYAYRLNKVNKIGDIKYFPFIRLINLILNAIVKPLVVEVLLSWSSRWKEYSDESFKDLRKVVKKSVDPLYPDGANQPSPTLTKKDTALKFTGIGAIRWCVV